MRTYHLWFTIFPYGWCSNEVAWETYNSEKYGKSNQLHEITAKQQHHHDTTTIKQINMQVFGWSTQDDILCHSTSHYIQYWIMWLVTISWFLIKDVHHSKDNYSKKKKKQTQRQKTTTTTATHNDGVKCLPAISVFTRTRPQRLYFDTVLFEKLKELWVIDLANKQYTAAVDEETYINRPYRVTGLSVYAH